MVLACAEEKRMSGWLSLIPKLLAALAAFIVTLLVHLGIKIDDPLAEQKREGYPDGCSPDAIFS